MNARSFLKHRGQVSICTGNRWRDIAMCHATPSPPLYLILVRISEESAACTACVQDPLSALLIT